MDEMADHLHEAAIACCQAGGDIQSVTKLVDILNAPLRQPKTGMKWQLECENLLKQTTTLLDPSVPTGKELLDHVGAELPKVLVQYVGVSTECHQRSTILVEGLAAEFSPPREIYTAFLEAINMYSKPETLHVCLPLLRGLAVVFPRLKRRTAEFFKEALPGLLEAGRSAGQDESCVISNDPLYAEELALLPRYYVQDNIQQRIIKEIVNLAKVIRSICDGVQEMERLRDMLGIFALQLMSIACGAISDSSTSLPDLVNELLELLSFCNLSVPTLISTIDKKFGLVLDEDDIKMQENHLEVRRGAALAVYLKIQKEESGNISEVFNVLKNSQTPGFQVVPGFIILASSLLVHVACKEEQLLRQKGMMLMSAILEVYSASSDNNDTSEPDDALQLSIQIRPALQRLQEVIVYSQNPVLRQEAYSVFVKILKQVLPTPARFLTLHSLISSCGHPSLVSLLMTCVKDEVLKAWPQDKSKHPLGAHGLKASSSTLSPFISRELLQLIESVLRPNETEIVELPANSDAVVGALNLYRFLLIRESSGNTNYTHVLSEEELARGRSYWLLPLREQVLRVRSLCEGADSDIHHDVVLCMDCLQSVLYRCLELVEQLQLILRTKITPS